MESKFKSAYANTWDNYVQNVFPKIQSGRPRSKEDLKAWQVLNHTDGQYVWPGDEWGAKEDILTVLQRCLFETLGREADQLCEIGSGAGRYTFHLLEHCQTASVHCFDVSEAFLEKLNHRFADDVSSKRLFSTLLDEDPQRMLKTLRGRGLEGRIDAVVSFDAMVHVELHTLALYVATTAAVLREGGVLIFNVADATSDYGFAKLMHNTPGVFRQCGVVGGHFQWMSPDIIESLLTRLGFACSFLGNFPECNERDLFVVARLVDRSRLKALATVTEHNWWQAFAG
ncbi:class I SAM-dependent methyltransferase [Breoghania sp.]|uniref:class I SAM-dependent methyltransferase n=1 Tax=Breoghania sp. TaxID=2065378 RepID=UPI002637796F|nr:class I SAM-dependent methyltransferase [Breoghania sp.]MDJ0933170.1 class I SAM-dependent methyltransferase [Breoghania sp.]